MLSVIVAGCGNALLPERDYLQNFSGNFEATAQITKPELHAMAEIHRSNTMFSMGFTQPVSLDGMNVTISGGNTTVEYKGMDFTLHRDTVPTDSIARLIGAAFDTITSREGLTTETTGEIVSVSGRIGADSFTAEINHRTGVLIKLSLPGRELQIAFENFIVIA